MLGLFFRYLHRTSQDEAPAPSRIVFLPAPLSEVHEQTEVFEPSRITSHPPPLSTVRAEVETFESSHQLPLSPSLTEVRTKAGCQDTLSGYVFCFAHCLDLVISTTW